MVFESVLVDILNRYLKPYVKKLDSSQLKLGAWKGHVRVEKLELKEDLFAEADLDLPVRIKASYIDKLEMKIPWKKLTKDPLIVTIDEVYVILGPHLTTQYDPETELKRLRREKEAKIKKFEEARKKKKQKEKEATKGVKKRKDSAKPDTFTEKLVVHLLKNLVVKVRDVHVRYEDPTTNPSTTIAAGITLHSLELKSTDSNWKPGVIRETATLIYKLLELNCLSFYWNTRTLPLATLPQEEMVEKMREAIARPAVPPPDTSEYLLMPVSAAVKLTINLKPGADLNIPQLIMDFECEDIQVSLREKQFKSLTYTLEYYDRNATNQKFLKYKPVKPVLQDPKGWWRYAITAVLEEDVKRRTQMWSWKHMKQHRELCRLYLHKYKEKVHSLSPSSSLLHEIEELEDQLDVFNIMFCRRSAKKEKHKPKKPLVATPSAPTLVVPSSPHLLSSPPSPSSRRTSSPVPSPHGHPLPLERKGSSPQPSRRNLPPRAPSPTLRSPASGRRQTSPAPLPLRQQPPPSQLARPPSPRTLTSPSAGERQTVESGKSKSKKDKRKKSTGFFSNLKRRLSRDSKSDETSAGAGAGAAVSRGDGMVGGEGLTEEVTEDVLSGPVDTEKEEQEKQELYEAIGYTEDEEYEEFPKDYVAHKFFITLASLTLELSGAKQLGNLITTEVKVTIDNRPSAEAVSVSASVCSLEMTGVPQGDGPTPFINSEVGGEVGAAPLLDFLLEVNPLGVDTDLLVKATLQPLELIYDAVVLEAFSGQKAFMSSDSDDRRLIDHLADHLSNSDTFRKATVDGLIEAFDVPKDIHLQELSRAATATLDQLKYQTTAELQEALKNRKEVQVDITLHSPFVVLPESGLYSSTASLIVADLGRLTLTSSSKNKSLSTGPKGSLSLHRSDTFSDSYDTFTVGLQGMQVLVARPGEDWRSALRAGSSPLHILDPTSCEIQLLKSIVVDTAYLPSFKIEGNLAGFEVNITNEKLGAILQIASSIEKPPALVARMSEIDRLPAPPLPKSLDEPDQLAETISLDSISVASLEEEDEESSEDEDTVPLHPPTIKEEGGEGDPGDAAKQVFIDLSVKLTVAKVAVKLSQVQLPSRELTPLLDVIVGNMRADVVDRQWDTQGSVTMKSITILDYITKDSEGKPTHLLETEHLNDGNFITTRFAMVTQKGLDFAKKYTNLQDSVSAQMSLVKVRLERQSLATLLQLALDLQPYLQSPSEGEEQKKNEDTDGQEEAEVEKINPNDVKIEKTPDDFYFEVGFTGLDVALTHQQQGVAEATVKGFKVKGKIEKDKTTVFASMEDLEVRDLSLNAAHLEIVTKADEETNIITLEVVEYNRKSHERDPVKLDWVDTELKAEIQRVLVKLETGFLENVFEYIKHLQLDQETLQIAAKATAGTAEVTAAAIKESTKTAYRFKMDIALHAPLVVVPYHTQSTEGEISINLGDFHLSNKFLCGADVLSSKMETMNVKLQRVVLDQMVVESTAIHISRRSRQTVCDLHGIKPCLSDSHCTILESLQVTAQVTRNISTPTRLIPNTDVKLGLKDVKFHLHDEDVKALIMIGLGASKITEVLAPPRKAAVVETRPKAKSDVCTLELSTTGQRLPPGPPSLSVPRPRTRTSSKSRRLYEEITDVKVDLSLQSVSVDLTTVKGPLFMAEATGLKAEVKVFRERVFISGSTATLSVVDLSPNVKHSKLVTLAKGVHNVSSIEMKIFLKESRPLSPLGEINATLSKIQLVLLTPTLVKLVEFVQSVIADIGPSIVTKPKKPTSSSTYAVANQEAGVYFVLNVTMHAPAILLPLSEDSNQGFMVDLGKVKLLNALLKPEHTEEYIGIDGYGITLESFKISRVLLDYQLEGSPVVAERVLLQPFQLQLTVERNLCPWYTRIPDVRVKCTMGELTIFLGQEDLEQMYIYGQCIAEQVSALVEGDKAKKAAVSQSATLPRSQAPPSQEETEPVPSSPPTSPTTEVHEQMSVTSTLSKFELRLFRKEPQLTQDNVESMELPNDYALSSLQLLGMELKAKVLTNQEANVEASMQEIVLCDQQKNHQQKKTGNRVIQIYTSNPLEAYTGILDTPIINIQYLHRGEEHFVVVKAEKLLVLSDVEFLQAMSEYFAVVFSKKLEPPIETAAEEEKKVKPEEVVEEDLESEKAKELLGKEQVPPVKSSLPKIKVEASVKDFRVALIEDVNAPEPQALTLKVSTFFHMSLTEDNKQGALNVVDLSIATSNFFDLDTTTSWVLLPCSLLLSLTGPIDTPAMDIHGMVDPLYFTLSPPVVRLIILAANSLIPPKEMVNIEPPADLWNKKSLNELKPWFLSPVPVHKAPAVVGTATEKGESLTLTFQSVEIVLESESTLKSRGHPVLAVNGQMVLQLSEWSGELSSKAELFCEASYYNEKLSLWEPLLEPLESTGGQLQPWCIDAEVKKSSSGTGLDLEQPEAMFSLSLYTKVPLQLTLTNVSLGLLKILVESYSKEYGKKVEGSVKVRALTGAPFTIISKLGDGTTLSIDPGPSLKLKAKTEAQVVKLAHGQSVNLFYKRDIGRRSYASLVYQASDQERHTIVMAVDGFKVLGQLLISDPGLFYRTLQPNKGSETSGVVIDVAVTGTKKTITVRSALQFHNHLKNDVDLLVSLPGQSSPTQTLAVLSPDEVYHVPIDYVNDHDFYVRPAKFGFAAEGPILMWFQNSPSEYVNLKCQFPDLDDAFYFIRVVCKKEEYKRQIDIPAESFTHYILHLHPPLMVQNLLPFEIFLGSMEEGCVMRSLAPGKHSSVHDLDIENTKPKLTVSVSLPHERSLMGKYEVITGKTAYSSFVVAAESRMVDLSVHTEDLDYHKLAIFSPFWMINKTELTLEYKEGAKITKHPPSMKIVLLSTKNEKNKIQLGAFTPNKSHTDWTKSFSLNAVGTSGNFSARLGENSYRFGVEVRLSQFTLTKLVIITPYYLLVNETAHFLQVWEAGNKAVPTSLPPGEVIPFWPLKDGDRLVVSGGSNGVTSVINYRRPAFTVLRFDNEVVALCVDVQLLEAANTVTFSSYYPGCVPVQIVNHFQDLTLHFWQDSKSPRVIHHTLYPGHTQLYTWDDPTGKRAIKWRFQSTKASTNKAIDISKDGQATFKLKPVVDEPQGAGKSPSTSRPGSGSTSSTLSPPPIPGVGDSWISIDDTFDEQLISIDEQGEQSFPAGESYTSSFRSLSVGGKRSCTGEYRGTWKSFIDGLQRVLLFTPDEGVTDRIRAANSYSRPSFEASLSLKAVGLSLVDTKKKRELAYIAATQSGVIWQLEKGNKGRWKTLNNSVIALLEDAYQKKEIDVKHKSLAVNLETMEMFSPGRGKVRRTHHEGVFFRFCLSEKDYSFYGKIGHIQIDNQLPFAVYPHVLYPLPPPPTVASAVEPKPFLEASVILRRNDQYSGVNHFKYFHVLVQKLAVNADLGFILALVDFFSIDTDPLLEAEYVQSDIEYADNSLKETTLPELSKDFNASKNVFDVLHISPIKILLSFNVRSVGKNKDKNSVGDRLVQLFLHSIGVILTSVQDTEMKLSAVHVEYQPLTGRRLQRLFTKHYKTQALFQLHTLIFGLDVLGNPVSFVRGVVDGTIDLFYEPIKGSVLGPEEFLEGLGIGLRSFFGGTVGGLTGAGARITGAFGDVFAKLTFDEDFIDKRQQEKTKPPKLTSKLGGFAKNLFEGVTGVVTQPVKGLKKEGAVGLLKGTGRGLVGLLVRPAGGLIDLTSGTLSFVTRKTQIGNFEISDIRPPRFIGPNGVVTPYSPSKAVGTTLLLTVNEGKFAETDFYSAHMAISSKPKVFLLATDRHFLLIEKRLLSDSWKATHRGRIKHLERAVQAHETNVLITYKEMYEREQTIHSIHLQSEKRAQEAADVINGSYYTYMREGRND